MTLILPDGKVQQLINTCKELIRVGLGENPVTCDWETDLICSSSTSRSSSLSLLTTPTGKGLLKGQGNEAIVPLNEVCRKDLQLCIDHLTLWNGRSILTPAPDITITTDASLREWGGESMPGKTHKGHVDTGGSQVSSYKCSIAQSSPILPESLYPQSETYSCSNKNEQQNCSSISFEDGRYMVGGFAPNCPGTMGLCPVEPDNPHSRVPARKNEARIGLGVEKFHRLQQLESQPLSFPVPQSNLGLLKIDLFADRMNTQLTKYMSWFPDPFAQGTDKFQILWRDMAGYCFPPFSMICHCLAKIRKDLATMVVITPAWSAQAWYPVLLAMSCSLPILLPPLNNIPLSPNQQPHPLVQQGHLQLVAWRVTGQHCLQVAFQNKLLSYSDLIWRKGTTGALQQGQETVE